MYSAKKYDEDRLGSLGQAQDPDNMSDDDNAAPEMQSEPEEAEREDPLLLAIEDLEGRVVSALDDLKSHPGVRTGAPSSGSTVHEELSIILRPVMEVAAHTAPSVARTYYRGAGADGIEASCHEVYARIVADLVLPVILQIAQSDTSATKRAASLEFFKGLWQEYHKAGSWLDAVTEDPTKRGPYSQGSAGGHSGSVVRQDPALHGQEKRRLAQKLRHESEILRYWIQASTACMVPGVFTNEQSEEAVAARGVIAASASLRPALRHIAARIRDADDRGANRIFGPAMKMVDSVLRKLFMQNTDGDAIRSSCVKFLEIVCLCCSSRPPETSHRRKAKVSHGMQHDSFCLDDLPNGHPIITREALESIAEYAFSTLRGLAFLGGQRKLDDALLSAIGTTDGDPATQVVSILKPPALAYLEIEPSMGDSEESLAETKVDRSSIEFDFLLSKKSYALTVNAVSTLSSKRPVFFREGATCLARRTVDPPNDMQSSALSASDAMAVQNQLRASCLTLLRNSLSVTTASWKVLQDALCQSGMEIQAKKALSMAQQTTKLKTAGRAARARANMFYEWETSGVEKRGNKRRRDKDDALQELKEAKAARGLGNGIQMPVSMSDAMDLVLANIEHLPEKRPPPAGTESNRTSKASLKAVIDAIMTNGASLKQGEGCWYSRDGGSAWETATTRSSGAYEFHCSFKAPETLTQQQLDKENAAKAEAKSGAPNPFLDQCKQAAWKSIDRIHTTTPRYANGRQNLSQFANTIVARLAWCTKEVKIDEEGPASPNGPDAIVQSFQGTPFHASDTKIHDLSASFPLISKYLSQSRPSVDPVAQSKTAPNTASSLDMSLLVESYVQSLAGGEAKVDSMYGACLDLSLASSVVTCRNANEKPSDEELQKMATQSLSSLPGIVALAPKLTMSSLTYISALCDIDGVVKKSQEVARKGSQQSTQVIASWNATRQAAEKRATVALLLLRDAAFQRTSPGTRTAAVACAVKLASGGFRASGGCEDKALKLVMNVLYPRSDTLAAEVMKNARAELTTACTFAKQNRQHLDNVEANDRQQQQHRHDRLHPPPAGIDKDVFDKVDKPSFLFMALCVRQPDMIEILFEISSEAGADLLCLAVKHNMPKLARAMASIHGLSKAALKVAHMTNSSENGIELLLSFLEHLHGAHDKSSPAEEFIDTCKAIQELKSVDGKKDPRFLMPILSMMNRSDLIDLLPELLRGDDDDSFLALLERTSHRLERHALVFRDEPTEEDVASLRGMTLCEQLVFLHRVDFAKAGISQRRYLKAIGICLRHERLFNDRVIMAALDHISGTFLSTGEKLPLPYMRTIILVISNHESLHGWICNTLLQRLVDGEIYTDGSQWEGWMRSAKMLENTESSGVSSAEVINKLPTEQLVQYKARYG